MFNWDEEWNISFAGCGFRSIYYLGALSCILQQAPQLVHGASKICGASSGCLVAAALTIGIPIEQFCIDVLTIAKEARKHTLGVFHPTFSLLRTVRDSLLEKLPADAHLRASGRLCVSLTRLSDRTNVLVSEFDSREELIKVLLCSCFFPVYCGFIPPSYRGVLYNERTYIQEQKYQFPHRQASVDQTALQSEDDITAQRYMDGALSNNMPLFEQRNTITMAPFSGESDICPREGTFNFFEVHYGNVSIQVNTGNVHRICTSFLPTKPEKLAEICHNGYLDAHRFLRERDLLGTQHLPPTLVLGKDTVKPCCELLESAQAEESKKTLLNERNPHQEDHRWLDLKNLPVSFKKVLCEACRDSHDGSDFLPVKVVMYVVTLLMLPIDLTISLTSSVILSGCKAVYRLLMLTADLCRQTWSSGCKDPNSAFPERCSSSSSNSDLRPQIGGDKKIKPLTSIITPGLNKTLHYDKNRNLDFFSLTSACAGPSEFPMSACGTTTLNHRSKLTLHQ